MAYSTLAPMSHHAMEHEDAMIEVSIPILGDGFTEQLPRTSSIDFELDSSEDEWYAAADERSAPTMYRRICRPGKEAKGNKKNIPITQDSSRVPRSSSGMASPFSLVSGSSSHSYRTRSPVDSQIFERHVQDAILLDMPTTPVPSHLQIDDHIPSVLDASSEAITNHRLNPDAVEIITHSSHQLAAVIMTGRVRNESMSSSWPDGTGHDTDMSISSYSAMNAKDVRRLSFISFADVVQSDHADHVGSRENAYGLVSMSSSQGSPSPVVSPVSFTTSPPTSISAGDLSPTRSSKSVAWPALVAYKSGGEFAVETMSQALKKSTGT